MNKHVEMIRQMPIQWGITVVFLVLATLTVMLGSVVAENKKVEVILINKPVALVSSQTYDKYAFGFGHIIGQNASLDWVDKEIDFEYELLKAKQIGIEISEADSKYKEAQTLKRSFRGESVIISPFEDLNDQDYEALLRIVEAEAGSEDLTGKVLIANVVINRVRNKTFPNTVYKVVHQNIDGEAQFSPTTNGRYEAVVVSKQTIEAVEMAVNGTDYSEGALFFVSKKYASENSASWFDTHLKSLFVHGNHQFYTYK